MMTPDITITAIDGPGSTARRSRPIVPGKYCAWQEACAGKSTKHSEVLVRGRVNIAETTTTAAAAKLQAKKAATARGADGEEEQERCKW